MTKPPDPQRSAQIKAEATAWWVRLDSDGLETADYQAFQTWLNQDPAHRRAFEHINQLWGELDGLKPLLAAPQSPTARPSLTVAAQPKRRWPLWTAALVLVGVLFWSSPIWLWLQADFKTGIGESRRFSLTDGSVVHLNSNSAVAVNINTRNRELKLLKGEAWFQVSPDRTRPFRVHAGHGTVTALGTAFNIRLGDPQTAVTVTEHAVAVALDDNGQTVKLSQGQHLVYGPTQLGISQTVDLQAATAWQRGKLVFQNKPLSDVVDELNRYHPGHFFINDKNLAQRRINGVFSTDQPLAVLNALEKSLHLHSTHLGDYWVILHP